MIKCLQIRNHQYKWSTNFNQIQILSMCWGGDDLKPETGAVHLEQAVLRSITHIT